MRTFLFFKLMLIGAFAGAVFMGSFVSAQYTPTGNPTEAPLEPYIAISPDLFDPLTEVLYIEGRSEPNALVTVVLQKQGDKPVKFTVKADSLGEWVVAEKVFLSSGSWQIRARQQVGTSISAESNPRVIRSQVSGINLFGLNVRYVVIAGFAFFFLAILIAVFVYFKRKIKLLKRGLMEKQLEETESRFHEGIAEIRKGVMGELRALAENSQQRPLTPEEIERRDHLLHELEELEKNLDHDISEIEKRY